MYEKFEALLSAHNTKPYRVSKETGISTATLTAWKQGKYVPKPDKLQIIADYFNVPISYFYEDQPKQSERIYEVAAGPGRLNEGYEIDDAVLTNDEYSKVRIVGDSMLPVLHDGDLVLVHHITDVTPRDFAIVKINGDESTCKHVEITSEGVWLRAENKEVFEDKFYTVQEVLTLPVTIIGKATEIVSRKL